MTPTSAPICRSRTIFMSALGAIRVLILPGFMSILTPLSPVITQLVSVLVEVAAVIANLSTIIIHGLSILTNVRVIALQRLAILCQCSGIAALTIRAQSIQILTSLAFGLIERATILIQLAAILTQFGAVTRNILPILAYIPGVLPQRAIFLGGRR
ncbi:MAG: hypothetical protein WCK63_15915 [Betaproteobacteria bacterium]